MGIGTSKGAFYEDQFHYAQSQWDPKKFDDNEMVVTPNQQRQNKQLDDVELSPVTGMGIEVADKPDYDYEGWKQANPDVRMSPGQHYPDTFKLPNHITFSNESKYSTDATPGGQWSKQEDNTWSFKPSEFNLKQHSKEELQNYFSEFEKGNKLDLSVADRTTSSPLVTITDEDVDKAMGLGMSFSGGGLTTKMETVGKAALKYRGELFEDANHGLALNKLLDKHPADGLSFSKIEEGFTTSSGRFVDRYEAAKIARKGSQIDSGFPDDVMLLSEDLSK